MPSRQISLTNWGCWIWSCYVTNMEFSVNLMKKIHSLINSIAIKINVFAFNLQATTDWLDKRFKNVWSMITWNHTLKLKYENLLVLAEIARVQCISTANCERAFLVQNYIKKNNEVEC